MHSQDFMRWAGVIECRGLDNCVEWYTSEASMQL